MLSRTVGHASDVEQFNVRILNCFFHLSAAPTEISIVTHASSDLILQIQLHLALYNRHHSVYWLLGWHAILQCFQQCFFSCSCRLSIEPLFQV